MTKTEKVITRLKAGDSDEAIMAKFKIKAPFLTRCKTYWKKQESLATKEIVDDIAEVIEVVDPAPLLQFTPEQMAQMMVALQALQNTPAPKTQLSACQRHPNQSIKAGDNCPHCLKQSQVDNQRMINSRVAPPCPSCSESTYFQYGGVIRKAKRAGYYMCGNCEITYNMKGEERGLEIGQRCPRSLIK